MTLVAGIGDEVIEFFIGLLIIIIGVAAWWSTRIADRPLIRTVFVFERRTQNQQNNNQSSSEREPEQRNFIQEVATSAASVQPVTEVPEQEESKPPTASTSVGSNSAEACSQETNERERDPAEEEQETIVQNMDSDTCVVRQRRLDFFQQRQATVSNSNNDQISSEESTTNNQENTNILTENTIPSSHEDDIRIKLKYINDDLKLVNGKLQEPLGDFKRRHFELEFANDKLVRLIFNGQVLQRDDMTLQGCGLFDNCVVHCLVHQKRAGASDRSSNANVNAGSTGNIGNRSRGNSQSNGQQGREWDLGNLFFAIVSFILGAAWYFRYEYAQLYTVTATVALVGLTGIFTVLLVGMYFPDPEPPAQSTRS